MIHLKTVDGGVTRFGRRRRRVRDVRCARQHPVMTSTNKYQQVPRALALHAPAHAFLAAGSKETLLASSTKLTTEYNYMYIYI